MELEKNNTDFSVVPNIYYRQKNFFFWYFNYFDFSKISISFDTILEYRNINLLVYI